MSIMESTRKMKPMEEMCYRMGYSQGKSDAVVHGEWEVVDGKEDAFDCSECDAMVSKRFHYCPNCGAKMDGKAVE